MDPLGERMRLDSSGIPDQYHPLFKYLKGRYADSVVLTFTEIEDLLGTALPHPARYTEAWWLPPPQARRPSDISRAWRLAHRTAVPNLTARSVRFDRSLA